MAKPEADAAWLRQAVHQAYEDSDAALRALAQERSPQARCIERNDFHYVDEAGAHAIPAELFHRHYMLALQQMEFSLFGYCLLKRYGWEKRIEPVFSMRKPSWWRRLLRRAPLMELTVRAGPDGASLGIDAAARKGYINRSNYIVRLDFDMQRQLQSVHMAAVNKTFINKLCAGFKIFG